MSESEAMIVRNDASLTASFTEKANRLKQEALETAALIGRVTNADEQALAVIAQGVLTEILATCEKAREAAKAPVWTFGKRIDATAKAFIADLQEEHSRIAKLVGDFQTLELAKVRASQAAENKRLTDLERERQAEAAKATSHRELEQVHERYDNRTRTESLVVAPARAEGLSVKEEWEFEVLDIWALVRWAIGSGNQSCLTVEPRKTEIKALLKAGIKIPGINAWKGVKATVRAGQTQKSINV